MAKYAADNGLASVYTANPEEAVSNAKEILAYLPSNRLDKNVYAGAEDDPNRATPEISAIVAKSDYDVHEIIKAIAVAGRADVEGSAEYAGTADMLLFDTKGKAAGGNGTRFDWSLLRAYSGSLPFLIGGGIGPDDADDILHFNHPQFAGIDLNSRFETSPGIKDIEALAHFIEEVRK